MTFAGRTVPPVLAQPPGSPRPPPHVSPPEARPWRTEHRGAWNFLLTHSKLPLASADRQRSNTGAPRIKSDPQRGQKSCFILRV